MTSIKQDYFQWLCEMVHSDGPSQSYGMLLKLLHGIPFLAVLTQDLNRADDGIRLRHEYEMYHFLGGDDYELEKMRPTVLEVLIGLAYRMEDIMYDPEEGDQTIFRFWQLIANLGFEGYTDDAFADRQWSTPMVRKRIEKWMNREFCRNGVGSPFPLKHCRRDQRRVELLYQMNYYLEEAYPV